MEFVELSQLHWLMRILGDGWISTVEEADEMNTRVWPKVKNIEVFPV